MAMNNQSDIKSHLGIVGDGDDALLTDLQGAAESFIQLYCGRGFAGGSYSEDHDGRTKIILLQNYPVAVVVSLKIDPDRNFDADTIVDPDDYFVHKDRGLVESHSRLFCGINEPGTVRIAYSTAPGEVPHAILRASAELVGHWYRQVKTNVTLHHVNQLIQSDGSTETRYPWGQAGGFTLPPGVFELLRPYRVPVI